MATTKEEMTVAVGFNPMALLPGGPVSESTASLRRAGSAVPWAAVWQGRGAAGKPGAPLWQK